jgi:hypothetical protein
MKHQSKIKLDAHFRRFTWVCAGNERQVLFLTGTKADQINTHGTNQDAECTNHVRPGLIFVRPGLIFVQYRLNFVRDRTKKLSGTTRVNFIPLD